MCWIFVTTFLFITAQVGLNEEASYWPFLRLAMEVTWLASETEFLVWNCSFKLSKELTSTPLRLKLGPIHQRLKWSSVSVSDCQCISSVLSLLTLSKSCSIMPDAQCEANTILLPYNQALHLVGLGIITLIIFWGTEDLEAKHLPRKRSLFIPPLFSWDF